LPFTGASSPEPNSVVIQRNVYGILRMTLRPTSFDWQFMPAAGFSFTDSGSLPCHGRPPSAEATGSSLALAMIDGSVPLPNTADIPQRATVRRQASGLRRRR
jgi:hypothetical protein